ncbi:MAG: class I SAM-dependent methyltransferase [Anaerolineaceae bacterium]|nr:class I SAM-dependent methyltransferase [Anaerolineaceae bacterium]
MSKNNKNPMPPITKPWDNIFRREGRVFIEPHEALAEFIAALPNPPAHILDLGCGTGRHLVALTEHGFTMYGLDRSYHGLRLARSWLAEKGLQTGLCLQDLKYPLPCADNTFDGLISTQVIHHATLDKITKTVDEIWRVLKPGGQVFISTTLYPPKRPNIKEIEPGTYVPREGSERGLPHHYFTRERLRLVFHAFEIQKIFTYSTRHLCLFARKPLIKHKND